MKNEEPKFCQHCGNELIKRQTPVEAAMEWMKEEEAKEADKEDVDADSSNKKSNKSKDKEK